MRTLNILVADDETIIRMGLQRILEEAGHTVTLAADGRAALQSCERVLPDLAILDIKMPELDGIETARTLLERSPVPIIFLTAYGEKETIERAVRLPVMGYLVKPVKEAELKAMIELAAGRFEERTRAEQAAAGLQEEVASRRIIDRAKGLIMQKEGVSELEAYNRLSARARDERRTLQEVAEDVTGS